MASMKGDQPYDDDSYKKTEGERAETLNHHNHLPRTEVAEEWTQSSEDCEAPGVECAWWSWDHHCDRTAVSDDHEMVSQLPSTHSARGASREYHLCGWQTHYSEKEYHKCKTL